MVTIAQHIGSCFLTFSKEYVYFSGGLVTLSLHQAMFRWVLHTSRLAADSIQGLVT